MNKEPIKCCQPNDYKYAQCDCEDCMNQDRIEHVLSEIREEENQKGNDYDE